MFAHGFIKGNLADFQALALQNGSPLCILVFGSLHLWWLFNHILFLFWFLCVSNTAKLIDIFSCICSKVKENLDLEADSRQRRWKNRRRWRCRNQPISLPSLSPTEWETLLRRIHHSPWMGINRSSLYSRVIIN